MFYRFQSSPRRDGLAAATFVATLMLTAGALADPAVTWPQGWQLRDLATPTTKAGERFDGSNQLALKLDEKGQLLAALNLTVLAIKPRDKPTLESQSASMTKTVREGYTAKGLDASCDAPQNVALAGVAARQVLCHVRKGSGEILRQLVIIAVGASTVESLSYTAAPENYETHRSAFDATRDSLLVE